MIPEDQFPLGRPQPRVDSFEAVEPDGPELTAEEAAWPVAGVTTRADGFAVAAETEVVIRVRCDPSASAAEVTAFVEQLRSVVEATATRFPVQITLPSVG